MDVGDIVIGGLVIGGGYIAYRAWCEHQNATAAPGTPTGAAAASMTVAAAKSTVFGNGSLLRRLLPARAVAPTPVLSTQMTPAAAAAAARIAAAPIRAQGAIAATLPAPNAPAHSARLLVPVIGLRGTLPTQPTGDAPQPGDPQRGIFLRGLLKGIAIP